MNLMYFRQQMSTFYWFRGDGRPKCFLNGFLTRSLNNIRAPYLPLSNREILHSYIYSFEKNTQEKHVQSIGQHKQTPFLNRFIFLEQKTTSLLEHDLDKNWKGMVLKDGVDKFQNLKEKVLISTHPLCQYPLLKCLQYAEPKRKDQSYLCSLLFYLCRLQHLVPTSIVVEC